MNRLNPFYLFRGQWKSLADHRGTHSRPAVFLRLLLLAAPLGAGAWFFFGQGTLRDPGAILAALSLLAGALLAAFSQLSNWRQTLTQREEQYEVSDQIDRDHLDETAAQLLVASYSSAVGSLLLVVAMNFSVNDDGQATGIWTALAVAVSVYVLIVFLMAVPRLYSAYVNLNSVRRELSGFSKH